MLSGTEGEWLNNDARNCSRRRARMSESDLRVIGAGVSRTGTRSLAIALEYVGFGKCYRMLQIAEHPEHIAEWQKLRRGEIPNYDFLFSGYSSCTDFPAAFYYKELMHRYPAAKVILTVRDADSWYESACKTVFRKPRASFFWSARIKGLVLRSERAVPDAMRFAINLVHEEFFEGCVGDRERAKTIYCEWVDAVQRSVPSDRLLVFDVREGWAPLCRFLDVSVPQVSFPRSNIS